MGFKYSIIELNSQQLRVLKENLMREWLWILQDMFESLENRRHWDEPWPRNESVIHEDLTVMPLPAAQLLHFFLLCITLPFGKFDSTWSWNCSKQCHYFLLVFPGCLITIWTKSHVLKGSVWEILYPRGKFSDIIHLNVLLNSRVETHLHACAQILG